MDLVDAIVERIILESAEKQLSEAGVAKMQEWNDKKKQKSSRSTKRSTIILSLVSSSAAVTESIIIT